MELMRNIHNPNFALNIARHRFKMVPCTIVLVLGILFMETLSLPLDLEVSIKGAQNGSITSRSWTCMVEGQFCLFHATLCCKPLHCLQYYNNPLILTCQKEKNGVHLESKGKLTWRDWNYVVTFLEVAWTLIERGNIYV